MPPPTPDADFLELQGALAGQYSLERELGRGGMGVVYLAREVQLERPVALKVLPRELARRPELRERFLREARTSAQLSHPNIVPIFRVDEIGGFVFFAMAYIEGETLTHRVRTGPALPPHLATRMIQEVAWALAYAHARGIVHRDIKPDNIMLEAGSGRAMVTDFGIARVENATGLTEIGQVMGTAHYMSPEQAAGEAVDGRSDLYSLGVVAHFALTGQLPFDGPTVQSILAKHLTQAPPPVTSINPAVPRVLAAAVDRCLAKEPSARFATGEELAAAVAESGAAPPELPLPLRIWLTRPAAGRAFYVGWSGFFGFVTVVSFVASLIPGTSSSGYGLSAGLTLLGLLPLALHKLIQTRDVLAAGYTLDDLRQALRVHVQREREEQAYEADREPTMIGRVLRVISYAALAGVAGFAGLAFIRPDALNYQTSIGAMLALAGVSVATGLLGLTFPGRRVRAGSSRQWRLAFWDGRPGELVARLARIGLRPAGRPAEGLHRPTEVAIGMAAGDLFATLPKSAQRELRDLPAIVHGLEAEAGAMRRHVAALDDQLSQIPSAVPSSRARAIGLSVDADATVEEHRRQLTEDLREAREASGKRLGECVAALENIRLDLLRLQAGVGSTGALTAALAAARRIGASIDSAIEGDSAMDHGAPDTPPRGRTASA